MRDIKFRVWDKDNKEMIYQSENTTKPNGIMEAQFTFDEIGAWIFTRIYGEQAYNEVVNFELMQYTGLKDKNEKEIYEGDIVKWTKREYTNCSREEIESEDVYIGVMKWNKSMYGIYTSKGKGYLLMPYYIETDEFEVIGNIYENPELLQQ